MVFLPFRFPRLDICFLVDGLDICFLVVLILLYAQVILLILAANAAVGVITETNAEKALEVSSGVLTIQINCS